MKHVSCLRNAFISITALNSISCVNGKQSNGFWEKHIWSLITQSTLSQCYIMMHMFSNRAFNDVFNSYFTYVCHQLTDKFWRVGWLSEKCSVYLWCFGVVVFYLM